MICLCPPNYNRRDSMRLVRRVISGWPQAAFQLTCGHRLTVPTWHTGRTNPKPSAKWYKCRQCETDTGWSARFHRWYDAHADLFYTLPPMPKFRVNHTEPANPGHVVSQVYTAPSAAELRATLTRQNPKWKIHKIKYVPETIEP